MQPCIGNGLGVVPPAIPTPVAVGGVVLPGSTRKSSLRSKQSAHVCNDSHS